MSENTSINKLNQESGETQLFELIKQAGNEARERKQKTMARHFQKLQTSAEEVTPRKLDSVQR